MIAGGRLHKRCAGIARTVRHEGERRAGWWPVGILAGVSQKLVLVSLALIVIVSFSFEALTAILSSRWIEEDLNDSAIAFARAIAATIGDRRELGSSAILHDEIKQILAVEPNLLRLEVLAFGPDHAEVVATNDAKERLLFGVQEEADVRAGRVVSRAAADAAGRYWEVMAPVVLEGAVPGAVAARFSLAPADQQASRIRRWSFALTAISAVVTGLLMWQSVRWIVHVPISRFMTAIRGAQQGHEPGRVTLETSDEFGVLARHYNDMITRLNRFNEELQGRVTEATAELDQRYRQVQHLNELLFDLQRSLGHAERLAISGRIMAEVAHEVGTPLHSIAGHIELLQRDLPADVLSSDVGRRLSIIETQLRRVVDIIAQLLDLTRRAPGERRLVDVNELVRDMAEVVSPGISARGLTLDISVDPTIPGVYGYANQLQQVILNLLTNAIDATASGGRITVVTRALSDRGEVEIAVTDTGSGIPVADQQRIFEPFFSTKVAGRGTGLGLFISAQIVRDHRGRMELQSREGHGTTFRVILPKGSG